MKLGTIFKALALSATIVLTTEIHAHANKPWSISVDPLFWTIQESGAEDWAQIFIGDDIDILDVPFGWNGGVRVGIDYRCGSWDTRLAYTWCSSTGRDHAHSSGLITSSFLGNFYIESADGAADSGATYHDASIRWKIRFNMFDWELGYSYCICSPFSIRPFLGLKGGWISQSIHSKWENPASGLFSRATENLKNNYVGVGPSIGVNTKWKFTRCFGLFGDFSGALLWGHWSLADVYKNDTPAVVDVLMPSITGGSSTMRTFVGIEYESHCISMRLGYEAQFWFNQLRFYSLDLGRLNNLLTLQGATLNLNYRF